jgi:hypothetical protein
MDKEVNKKFLEIFGEKIVINHSGEELNSSITFILKFPDNSEEETRTNPIPNVSNVGQLFEEIRRIFPNRSNATIQIKYYEGIEQMDPNTGELKRLKASESRELSDKNTSDLNRNILLTFFDHYSLDRDSLVNTPTLELDVYFIQNQVIRTYFITKIPIDEKMKDKAEKICQKLFSKGNFKMYPIVFLNDYNGTALECEGNDKLFIIVDDTFMNQVVEKEITRATSINIMADKNNKEAVELQTLHNTKILGIHKNLDILMASKNFNLK